MTSQTVQPQVAQSHPKQKSGLATLFFMLGVLHIYSAFRVRPQAMLFSLLKPVFISMAAVSLVLSAVTGTLEILVF